MGKSGGKKAWPLRRRHESPGTMTYLNAHSELSQPQKIISRLETNFNLSPSYFAHKSANQKFSKIYEISLDANLYKTKQNKKTQTSNTIFSKNQSLRYCPCLKKTQTLMAQDTPVSWTISSIYQNQILKVFCFVFCNEQKQQQQNCNNV